MWPHVYIICVCLVFSSVGDLLGLHNKYVTVCVLAVLHRRRAVTCHSDGEMSMSEVRNNELQ